MEKAFLPLKFNVLQNLYIVLCSILFFLADNRGKFEEESFANVKITPSVFFFLMVRGKRKNRMKSLC